MLILCGKVFFTIPPKERPWERGWAGTIFKGLEKNRNVREKISEKMYGKKFRGSKILATTGRGEFVKFYLAPPKCMLPLKWPPPPQIPRPGAATAYIVNFLRLATL